MANRSSLDHLMDVVAGHFAARRDALAAVAMLGNRFEHWVKYEIVISIHDTLAISPAPWNAVAVEAASNDDEPLCDLRICKHPWPRDWSRPPPSEEDVWVELKTCPTRGYDPTTLGGWIDQDIRRLKKSGRSGVRVALGMVVRYLEREQQVDMTPWLSTHADGRAADAIRRIRVHSIQEGREDDSLLAILLAWSV